MSGVEDMNSDVNGDGVIDINDIYAAISKYMGE